MEKISYRRRVYESVDDASLPWDVYQKSTENRIHAIYSNERFFSVWTVIKGSIKNMQLRSWYCLHVVTNEMFSIAERYPLKRAMIRDYWLAVWLDPSLTYNLIPLGQMGINKARGMDQSGAPLEIDGEQAVIWLVVEFRGKYSSDI